MSETAPRGRLFWLFLCALLLLGWVESIKFVQQHINASVAQQWRMLQHGETPLDWRFNASAEQDIVGDFRDLWRRAETGGIVAVSAKPAISLDLAGRVVSRAQHTTLLVQGRFAGPVEMTVELTAPGRDDLFYYAQGVRVSTGENALAWSDLDWSRRGPGATQVEVSKAEVPMQFKSLVLRFYPRTAPSEAASVHLQRVALPLAIDWQEPAAAAVRPCQLQALQDANERLLRARCFSSNHLLFLDRSINAGQPGHWFLSAHRWLEWLPHMALVMGMWLMYWLAAGPARNGVSGAVRTWQRFAVPLAMTSGLWLLHNANWLASAPLRAVLVTLLLVLSGWALWRWLNNGLPRALHGYVVLLPASAAVAGLLMGYSNAQADAELWRHLPAYLLWAAVQQVLLGPLLARWLQMTTRLDRTRIAALCGAVFALAHMPNTTLMAVTFLAGSVWSYFFLRTQRLLPQVISHAVLALLFYQSHLGQYNFSAKVGISFVRNLDFW